MAKAKPDVVVDDIDAPFSKEIDKARKALADDSFRLGVKSAHIVRPQSLCFTRLAWTPRAKTMRDGQRIPSPGSLGTMSMTFRRNTGKRTYIFDTLFRFDFFEEWANSSSRGRFFNFNIKGLY